MVRIPVTSDGYRVIAWGTVAIVILTALFAMLSSWAWCAGGLLWLWLVLFFRDPERQVSGRGDVLYAPADGRITEVRELPDDPRIGGACTRIRIFLSLFDTHINRMPCAATVQEVSRRPGRFLNAMKSEAADENESATIIISPRTPLVGPMVVRQIAGLVARTIVCHAVAGQSYDSGQRFGMIRFGSGTELIVPRQPGLVVVVRPGDHVKAGLTAVARIDTMKPGEWARPEPSVQT